MSIFLYLVLAFFVSGILACYLLGYFRSDWIQGAATLTVFLSLIIWLIFGFTLRNEPGAVGNATNSTTWLLRVDSASWQLSLSLLILAFAFFLAKKPHLEFQDRFRRLPIKERAFVPSMLGLILTILLSLWFSPGYALILIWTLVAIIWLLLLWLSSDITVAVRDLLYRGIFMLSGSFFIWLALATSTQSQTGGLVSDDWPTEAIPWLYMAAAIQMGSVPFHWWRPVNISVRSSSVIFIHILPILTGAALLLRIPKILDAQLVLVVILTIFGLIGVLAGVIYSWMHLKEHVQSSIGLIITQVGSIVLISTWVGPEGVVAQTRVLILGLGALILSFLLMRQPYRWNGILPLAALSGMPLTIGFVSIIGLYVSWLSSIAIMLVIVYSLIMVLFLVGVLQAFWPIDSEESERAPSQVDRWRFAGALLLPSLGLLAIPEVTVLSSNPFALATILATLAIALGLDFVLRRDSEIHLSVRHAFHIRIPISWLSRVFLILYGYVNHLSRRIAAIFEGEGGLLWLFIFILVIWLAIAD